VVIWKRCAWSHIVIFTDSINLKFETLRVNIVISLFACSFWVICAVYPLGVWISTHNTNNYKFIRCNIIKNDETKGKFRTIHDYLFYNISNLFFYVFIFSCSSFQVRWVLSMVWVGYFFTILSPKNSFKFWCTKLSDFHSKDSIC
jgi:hypothetical protein